jgi:hypothetical protein
MDQISEQDFRASIQAQVDSLQTRLDAIEAAILALQGEQRAAIEVRLENIEAAFGVLQGH